MNVVKISDGLGNQMFQYAFARKLQIVTGRKVYLDIRFINNEDVAQRKEEKWLSKKNDQREYSLNHFKIKLQSADDKTLRKWSYLFEKNKISQVIYKIAGLNFWHYKYRDEDIANIRFERFVPTYFKGYFFDLNYYDDIRTVLQREFVLKEKIKLPIYLRKILKNENTVSIHIRRGDFLKLNRDISQKDYYPKALELVESKIQNPTYLVFSDDIEWVKENLKIKGNVVYVSEMGFQDYEELTLMKYCKHNIIANSTFSYWAAYLNSNEDKIVICPKRWKTKIIPKEWIKL